MHPGSEPQRQYRVVCTRMVPWDRQWKGRPWRCRFFLSSLHTEKEERAPSGMSGRLPIGKPLHVFLAFFSHDKKKRISLHFHLFILSTSRSVCSRPLHSIAHSFPFAWPLVL